MRSLLAANAARLSRFVASTSSASTIPACQTLAFSTIDSLGPSCSYQGKQSEPFFPPAVWGSHSGTSSEQSLIPQLCATPKKKLSVHRRGNRRVWYWLKRKPEYAKCSFCGALSGRNNMFSGEAGNPLCNGRCVELPAGEAKYPDEYKPPC